ncbi:MAG: helix-turn-helix domain-containing protein, partial [Methanosarcinales archaeon]|nr:helix-turn-helix domain-containing protein [Methanosarcinales archaeon]
MLKAYKFRLYPTKS